MSAFVPKRGPKGKNLAPPSDNLIALGTTSSAGPSVVTSSAAVLSKQSGVKRDSSMPILNSAVAAKKAKLSGMGRQGTTGELWLDNAVEVDPYELLQRIQSADDSGNEEKVEQYICGSVKQLKNSRLKIEPSLYLTLLYLVKVKPQLFCGDTIAEAFCSLLKKEPSPNLSGAIRKRLNANNGVPLLAANIMLAVFKDETYWPKTLVKVYVDDALNERNWVDRISPDVLQFEDTLLRLLTMGLSKTHPISAPEAIEMADALIRRAASFSTSLSTNAADAVDSTRGLSIQNEELFQLLFRSSVYRIPDNIAMPPGYEPPAMAISDWYWKVWIQLLIITAHNPVNFGQKAWKNYPTLSLLIEMTITNHFEFPPPTMQADDLKNKLRQILAVEKQQIIQFETQLAAASTKQQITESNSLLLSKLIQYDPEGPAREPPPAVLDQLRSVAASLKLGHLLCQSRSPDFLLEIIQRQQKQRSPSQQLLAAGSPVSMPWLSELVELNEDNYSVLSVRSLCVYLLGHIYEEENSAAQQSYDLSGSATKNSEKLKKKEKRRKQVKLIAHLQSMVNTSEQVSRDLIEFFMERLSIQQSSLRQLASKALNVIFRDLDCSDDFTLCPENDVSNWLLHKLPATPHFEAMKHIVCEGLRLAILIETHPKDVCSYVQFLEKYANPADTGIALSLSNLLIDRTVIARHLTQDPLKAKFLEPATRLFHAHLQTVKKRDGQAYWSEAQDKVMIQWESGESAVLNIMIVHAMIILLTYGPTESSEALYSELMETWFSDPPPQSFLVDTSEEALLIPDWLKMKLIRSASPQLADAGLMDLEPHQLVLFIQSFGIPETSMEKLLTALDECCETNEATLMASITDRKFMKHLVEVQWMRGVGAGHKFAEMLDVPDDK